MKEKSEEIRDLIEGNKDKVKLLIGGNFNARTRNKGRKEWGEEGERGRKSKERILNREGENLSTEDTGGNGMVYIEWKHGGR